MGQASVSQEGYQRSVGAGNPVTEERQQQHVQRYSKNYSNKHHQWLHNQAEISTAHKNSQSCVKALKKKEKKTWYQDTDGIHFTIRTAKFVFLLRETSNTSHSLQQI